MCLYVDLISILPCCFQFALSKLIRGNELELAVSIGMVLNDDSQMYHLAVEFLARKCERLGKW